MVFKQEVNIPLALTIGLISGLLILVMTFGMQAWYESAESAIVAENLVDAPRSEFVQLKDSQRTSIERYGWADKSHTNVKIPIARAMEIMVADNGNLPRPTSQPSTQPAAATQPTASADVGK